MGQKRDLTSNEKSTIASDLGKEKTTIEILGRDHRTVKKSVQSQIFIRSREDEGKSRVPSNRTLSHVKREVVRNPYLTSRELFKCLAGKTYRKLPGVVS